MTAISTTVEMPTRLIRWNYLWYVAAALAVMVAAI
jgi:hypothetical protein